MPPNGRQHDDTIPIAVVGMSFRGPGDATDAEGLLRMVAEGRESRSPIPREKWNHEAFYHPDSSRHGAHNVEYGHWFQQDVYEFDAPFFNISAPEAAALDPQQRMLLECSYEAFENSGTPMSRVIGTDTSVFAACFATDYTDMLWRDPETVPTYQCTNSGFTRANMANRISFSFDLKGSSVTVDTACSGGLTALHLACQSLLTGDSRQAIAAGSSLILGPEVMITMSMMKFLSPDGRCYAFDERANGYARGEGVAVLLLKRLDDALADGDTIRAIIRGTGCNQDGKTPGITMPNGASQEALIRSVYQKTGLDPLETSYVECHGTGTQAGDTTETGALQRVFCSDRQLNNPLVIGSIKTNIGHLEGASGLAGIIKSILMLENGIILPHRNFETANPRIPLREWALRVPTAVEPWTCSAPRRASVNSFGYGGANVHAILESAHDYLRAHGFDPSHSTRSSAISVKVVQAALDRTLSNGHSRASVNGQNDHVNGYSNGHTNGGALTNGHANGHNHNGLSTTIKTEEYSHFSNANGRAANPNGHTKSQKRLFALSAFDPKAGEAWAVKLADYVRQRPDVDEARFLDSLSFTLSNRRTIHSWKSVITADSRQDLISQLEGSQFVNVSSKTKLGLVFTGQGAQWCGMGKELIHAFPKFRESLEQCDSALVRLGAWFGVIDELQKDFENSQINKPQYSQPLCTALQIALVNLLDSWGIHPDSVTGHSSGEIAAAYCAGALSLEDAMLVAYARGSATVELAEKGVDGAMAAVSMTREELSPLLSSLQRGKASIACSNSPSSFTVSGDKAAVDELQQVLRAQGVYNRRLVVGVAYHSHHMTLVADSYRAAIDTVEAKEGSSVKFFSSVTGKMVDKSKLGPEYWVSNLVSEVRFAQSLHQLAVHEDPNGTGRVQTLIEVGPHAALAGPIRQILQAEDNQTNSSIECLSVLIRKKDAVATALSVASSLFVSGYAIQLSAVNMTSNSRIPPLIDLPCYAWNHTKSYNAESRISKAHRQRQSPRTDLLGVLDAHSSTLEPRWRQIIRLSELPWLRDHSIQSAIVYPAAGYITMAMEAAQQRVFWGAPNAEILGYQFREITISSALLIPETPGEVEVIITLKAFAESVRSPSNLWDEFSVSSVSSENRWTEHCRGLIAVQTPAKTANLVNGPAHEESMTFHNQDLVSDFENSCRKPVEAVALYSSLREVGMQYGPSFANMQQVRSAPGRCISEVQIPDTRAVMPMQYERASVVHPATLDSIFQTYLPALAEQMGHLDRPVVPVGIENMFISNEFSRQPGDTLASYTSTTRKDNRYFSAEMKIFEGTFETGKRPVVHLEEMTMAALERDPADERIQPPSRAYRMKWAPDVELLSDSQIVDVVRQSSVREFTKDLELELVGSSQGLPENMQAVAAYLHLLAHKNPAQRVLLTGPQSGMVVVGLLSLLSGEYFAPFKLHCTDLSGDAQQGIEARFPDWVDSITHGDIEMESGGSQEPYDVVVSCNSPDAKSDISQTLSSMSQIVLPGGKLIVLDDGVGKSNGHSGTNGHAPDLKSMSALDGHIQNLEFNKCQVFCDGTAVFQKSMQPTPRTNVTEVLIIVPDELSPDIDVLHLQSLFQKLDIAAEVTPLKIADPNPTQFCIVLTDLSKSSLAAPTELEWASIKRISHGGAGILWITRGAGGDICTNPEASLVQGFARTIRSETGDRPVVTLDLDGTYPLGADDTAEFIVYALRRLRLSTSSSDAIEQEFIERRGALHIPRLIEDIQVSKKMQTGNGSQASQPKPSLRRLEELGSSRLFVETPGLLDTLHFAPDDRTNPSLQPGEIELDVKAAGINFKDVMMAMGQIPVEDLGCESSGVISAIGEDVKNDPHGLRPGDRVMCLSTGSFCTKLRLDARLAERIPDSMPFDTAAAIPITHVTAYHSLHNIARLRKGEKILIHAATGGLGQALVEMSQLVGAEVFVTVGSAEKKTFIIDRFGIPEQRILYSRDTSFAQSVMYQTAGRGVDVIVNSLAGEALRQSWTCIAPNGRFVELGQRDITINTRLDMKPFARNASFTAFNLAFTMKHDPQAARDVLIKVLELFANGSLRGPDPLETYAFSDLQQAFRKMQTGRHMGKLVAVAKPDDMVKYVESTTDGPLLRPDASYLLVGGLGGIGRATALWMASRGAKHLIFLNRSGLNDAAQDTVSALQAAGCTASVLACDVADSAQLTSTLETARHQLPPIRGVIQGAMVLRDCMLEKMSLEDYLAVLRPKLHGTRNLHTHLPDLDFFVMESSISGIIGNTAQAAYAAANTFLDAFARYRRSTGHPASTIDIGAVSGVGYLAQNEDLQLAMQRQGFEFTDEAGIMRLLEFAIRNPTRDVERAHIITGLGAWNPDTSLQALRAPMFSRYRMLSSCFVEGTQREDTLSQALKRSKDVGGAVDVIVAALVNQIVAHTGVPVENVSTVKSLQDYGIDSLAAVELKNWISKEMESVVPIFELMSAESLDVLAAKIAGRSRLVVSSNGA
ncbi:unnamed protein product [Penicillium salamii]|uniref:Uncharacterized protein n=1 Tax=Penicillium salamii TaxID=1612424 RepID=A0A9W4NG08_9EURO|nr:unnamed protein product [Penicillium salamii]CAG8009690.1 unnamed protein product [Penicillium salamii]CAG8022471.1 unnamed protein product [Penicillium salamii]CAG8119265.1 unnamed protein product [Penicillium salamii]CAG8145179.1 unnamed protein product [Penicillium salamii]